MARIIRRKYKSKLIRDAEKRAAAQPATQTGTGKRIRTSAEPDPDDVLEGMFDTGYEAEDTGYEGGDDFSDVLDPPSANDFDETQLAEMLVQNEDDNQTVFEIDEQGQVQLLDEDLPLQEELKVLAEYQYLGDFQSDHGDEVEGVIDEQDLETETAAEDEPTPGTMTSATMSSSEAGVPTPGSLTSATMTAGEGDTEGMVEAEAVPENPFPASNPVERVRKDHKLSDFSLAFGLYCIQNGVSRKQYSMLKEILDLLKDGGREKINALPDIVDTLKRHVREKLPSLQMRTRTLTLNPDKLPSSRLHAAEVASMGDKEPTENLYFMNPIDVYSRVLSSKLADSMHFGMATLVDNPTEAWHSLQWAASIRSTSGDFAYYPNVEGQDRNPIFPGDFLRFKCGHVSCFCRKDDDALHDMTKCHSGQVLAIYRDQRKESWKLGNPTESVGVIDGQQGQIVLVLSRLWEGKELIRANAKYNIQIKTNPITINELDSHELILTLDPVEYISSNMVIDQVTNIGFDYAFGSHCKFHDDPVPTTSKRLVRRVYHMGHSAYLPVCKVAPVAGQLEMEVFGRDALVRLFTMSGKIRSMPSLTFADGFGLYRVMYKALMGVYNEITALPKAEHSRQINIFPLTLGPHGSNLVDVMKTLEPMTALDKGLIVKINGESVVLCAPILAFTGDMPQQQANSGMLSVQATQGCRSCEVDSKKRGDLDYDIVGNQRGHIDVQRQRRLMDGMNLTNKKKYSSAHGLAIEAPAVGHIAPALDVIRGRPSDSAHSEFGGIVKMIHQILLDQVLKPKAIVEYARVLRRMPFPPGWPSIPSPYHVLTYNLHEHGRWVVLATVIARCWLREHHIKVAFIRAVKIKFHDDIRAGEFGESPTAVDILIRVLAETVRTNCLLATDEMNVKDRDPNVFMDSVRKSRRLFQQLCKAAAVTSGESRARTIGTGRSRAPSRASTTPSIAPMGPPALPATLAMSSASAGETTMMPSIEQEDVEDDINVGHLSSSQKATKYRQWAARPNVHVGLHYLEVFKRYGIVSLLMVLSGEKKHKVWKDVITSTNHRNPEKDLFEHENLVQTLRLILIDGFQHDEPEVTQAIKDLSKRVPTMFAALLPPDIEVGIEDEDDPSMVATLVSDATHYRPTALIRIKATHCKQVLGLPIKEKEMSKPFHAKLSQAYGTDYKKPGMIITSNNAIKWWKKISFSDSNKTGSRRFVFQRGQYVAYHGDRKARLDHIFTHEILPGSGLLYTFMVVTPVKELPGREELLTKLPIVAAVAGQPLVATSRIEDTNQELIGLPALGKEKLYMVPFDKTPGGWSMITDPSATITELLWVNWRIQYS